MLSERSRDVLRAVVQTYIASHEPVGSKTIVERHAFGVSAATIRNDMALLEEEGYIVAPHTSSGRIPTDRGYRLFVDQLTELQQLSAAQRHAIDAFLSESENFEDLLSRTVRLLAQLTQQLAVVRYPAYPSTRVRHCELASLGPQTVLGVLICDSGQVEQTTVECAAPMTPEALADLRATVNEVIVGRDMRVAAVAVVELGDARDVRDPGIPVLRAIAALLQAQHAERLVVAGTANLLRRGDIESPRGMVGVVEAIEEQVVILRLFSELVANSEVVAVRIGQENAPYGLADTSVISSAFAMPGRDVSRLGVVGPTHMDYPASMTAVRAVASYLSRTLGRN